MTTKLTEQDVDKLFDFPLASHPHRVIEQVYWGITKSGFTLAIYQHSDRELPRLLWYTAYVIVPSIMVKSLNWDDLNHAAHGDITFTAERDYEGVTYTIVGFDTAHGMAYPRYSDLTLGETHIALIRFYVAIVDALNG